MTSAAKHAYRSHRSNPHFISGRNYRIKVVDPIIEAKARRPKWFWNLVDKAKKMVSGLRKQDRGQK